MGKKKLLFRLAATMEARRSQNDDFQRENHCQSKNSLIWERIMEN